ncbi:hemerythrin domain-containing protein [Clostridium weizhouense]|uniref:Hemerythrin domain-containing protein n=1 Tax=Clostridium weizhouense TaxID=2859781 RepID=A0ABS7AMG6_9CLOT|nr:hemerythrin domain-containing protein [Clostridium weizhouense]MBW6409273.1 hemerythrin domain-containing protein [Clostridium weizhouense]
MNAIDIMMEEHRYIERMLNVVRNACFKLLKEDKVNYDDFYSMINFIKNYADGHHHNKEEIILFNRMVENLGALGEKTIKNGMLVEHDLGRLYIKNLEEALENLNVGDEEAKLDVIANAISYTHLLKRHIEKEDNVIYKFAQRELNTDILENIDKECVDYENQNVSIRNENINILENLEKKYLTTLNNIRGGK